MLGDVRRVYESSGLACSAPVLERESSEYSACTLVLNNLAVRLRRSKITPAKVGQFVTVWKRVGRGPIQPFDESDLVDFFVICCRTDRHSGQFVFPKSVLCDRNIIARNGSGGKRAMRVYPAWDTPTSLQALRSQKWQLEYFLETSTDVPLDRARTRRLFGLEPVSAQSS
jgi:hypothetical protein